MKKKRLLGTLSLMVLMTTPVVLASCSAKNNEATTVVSTEDKPNTVNSNNTLKDSIPNDANETSISYYLAAVASGYTKTYAEWKEEIASQKVEFKEEKDVLYFAYKDSNDWKPLYATSSLKGDAGETAYQIYLKYHADYAKGEAQWYIDLVNGDLSVTSTGNPTTVTASLEYTLNSTLDGYLVTGIGDDLTSKAITIPATYQGLPVVGIEEYAFYYRNDITYIDMPSSISYIANNAFMGCSNLNTIKTAATDFGEDAFYGCASLTNIYYKNTIKNWLESDFSNEYATPMAYAKNAYMQNAVGDYTNYNSQIVLDIPRTTTKINSYALLNFNELVNVVIPDTVTAINEYALKGCKNLEAITLPFTGTNATATEEKAIFGYIFGDESYTGANPQTARYNADGDTETYYIPNKLQSITIDTPTVKYGAFMGVATVSQFKVTAEIISEYAFSGCSKLESTNMTGVTQIKTNAFEGCAIKDFSLPDTLECLGAGALSGLTDVKSITIPGTVKAIEKGAFKGASNLEEITITTFNSEYSNYFSGDAINTLGYIFGDESYTGSTKITQEYSSTGSHAFYIPSKLKTVNFDVKNETAIPYGYLSNITTITNINILDGSSITSIGDYAYKNTSITELDLSGYTTNKTVLTGLTKLETLNLGNIELTNDIKSYIVNVKNLNCGTATTTIPSEYFKTFTKLEKIDLENVTTIQEDAFYMSTSLKTAVGKKVTSIGNNGFYNTSNLTSVDFPLLETIGSNGFYKSAVTTINTNNLMNIGASAFSGSSITTLDLSKCISIEQNAFENSSLTGDIVLNNCSIYGSVFENSKINTLEIKGKTTIPQYFAKGCTNLTKVVTDATNIDNYAFEGCTSLTEFDLSAVTELGINCCKNTKLKEIILNDAITNTTLTSNTPFSGCTGAEKIYTGGVSEINLSNLGGDTNTLKELILGESATTISSNIYSYNKLQYKTYNALKYLSSKTTDYFACFGIDTSSNEYMSYNGAFTINNSCKIIASKAFNSNTIIKSITLGNNTKYINSYAFSESSITKAVLKNSSITIADHGFNKSQITDIDLSYVVSIKSDAFYKCTGLTSVDASNATYLGSEAFYGCTNLTTATLNTKLTLLNSGLFQGCTKLSSCNIPTSVTLIYQNVFCGCSSYSVDLNLPNVTTIYASAFSGSAVKSLTAAKVEIIGAEAFRTCTKLTTITAPKLTSINNSAFYGCTNLTTLSAVNVTTYGDYAFKDCIYLKKINYTTDSTLVSDTNLKNATSIGTESFNNCGLTRIKLGNLKTLGTDAFMLNNSVKEFDLGYYEVPNNKFIMTDFISSTNKITNLILNSSVYLFDQTLAGNTFNPKFEYNIVDGLKYIPGHVFSSGGGTYPTYMCVGVDNSKTYTNLTVHSICQVIAKDAFNYNKYNYWDSNSTHTITIPGQVMYINNQAICNDTKVTTINIQKAATIEKTFYIDWVYKCDLTASKITLSGATTDSKLYRSYGSSAQITMSVVNTNLFNNLNYVVTWK